MTRIYLLLITAMSFVGCQQNNGHADHEEAPAKPSFTGLNDQLEIFAEYAPLIRNSASQFAIHLTSLANYKPIEDAQVTTTLVVGGRGMRKVLDSATVPGVYIISLEPSAAGNGTLLFDIKHGSTTHQFRVAARVFANEKEFKNSSSSLAKSPDEIHFPKEKSWTLDFGITKISPDNFSDVVRAPATITVPAEDLNSIVATAPGMVKFGAGLTSGSRVYSGQRLFSISGAGLTGDNLNVSIKEAKLNLDKAKSNYERARSLHPDQIISDRDYESALNEYQRQRLNYQKLSGNFSGNGVFINAVKAGYLMELLVKEGQYVQAGDHLATLTANKKIQLVAEVSGADASQLNQVRSVNFKINGKLYELDSLNGKLLSYGRNVSASGLIPVVFSLDNRPEFFPGIPVEAYILTRSGAAVLQIPEAAVMEDQGNYFAYVQKDGEHFERRAIRIGESNGRMVEIASGLRDGDVVVTKGAYYLKLAAAQTSVPAHGHEH